MNSDDRKAIDAGLETHLTALSYKSDEHNNPLIKKSKERVEYDQLLSESSDILDKYALILKKKMNPESYNDFTQTNPIPYRSYGQSFNILLNLFRENVKLSYYFGNSYSDPSFIGLVYGIEFRLKNNLADAIIKSAEYSNLKNIYAESGSLEKMGSVIIPPSTFEILRDPFEDSPTGFIELQLIRPDNKMNAILDFYEKCHTEVLKLDTMLVNSPRKTN